MVIAYTQQTWCANMAENRNVSFGRSFLQTKTLKSLSGNLIALKLGEKPKTNKTK
jgi:hypothetical protein